MTSPTTRPGLAPAPRRGLRAVAAVASTLVLLTSGVAWAGVAQFDAGVTRIQIPGLGGEVGHSDPMNILLVASDSRDGITRSQAAKLHLGHDNYGAPRTDTMMLVHIGADAGSVSVISLPRDTLADLPAYTDAQGKKHQAHQAKLNAAFAEGGPTGMVATVESMTGLKIDHYVEISFSGFLRMVDAVGGVEVCLPTALKDKNSGLDLPAGRQTIQGAQALAYVRARYVDPTSDLGRMKRQQKFIASIVKKATSAGTLLNPVRLDSFLTAVAHSITTDSGLGKDQMLDLADRLKGTSPSNVAFETVPLGAPEKIPGIGDVLTWDKKKAAALFTALKNDQPIVAPAPSASASATTVTVAPSAISVAVLNGTSTTGLGARAANDLAGLKFSIAGPAQNATSPVGSATVVSYDPRWDQSAKTVAAAIPGSTLTPVAGLGRTIRVTVGTSYAGVQKVTVAKAPSPSSSSPAPRTAADDICKS
ncbi:MAG: LytR family transcriptional regulator [Frankiales bacterium]|nr:LytR family transcriptional regulator [Frankiales bacterium]